MTYPNRTLVEIVVSGSATYDPIGFPGQDPTPTLLSYGGYWMNGGCYGGVSWDFRPDDAWSFSSKQYCVMGGSPPSVSKDTVVVMGTGFGFWSRFSSNFPPWCGLSGPECYTYSDGDMSITVTAFAAEFKLTASAYRVQKGSSVTVAGLMTPATVGSNGLRFEFLSWSWNADGSGPSAPGCAGPGRYTPPNPIECAFAPQKSGVFKMKVIANGVEVEKQVRIAVDSCPPQGHDWMDNPDYRKKLEEDLANSGVGGPHPMEQTANWFIHDVTGQPFWLPPPTPSSRTNCSTTGGVANPDSGTLGNLSHTHPIVPNTWVVCDPPDNRVGRYPGGPSDADWDRTTWASDQLGGHPVSGCMIEPGGYIYCYADHVNVKDRPSQLETYKKGVDGCYVKQP